MPTEQEIRDGKLNWIGGYIHAVWCPHVTDRSAKCDCRPAEIAPATGNWVQEVFKPLPPEEAAAMRDFWPE